MGYGIETYELDYLGPGERIRIFTKEKNIKFHRTQYESIEDIKEFVRGKKKLKPDVAFKKERIAFYLMSGMILLSMLIWFLFYI